MTARAVWEEEPTVAGRLSKPVVLTLIALAVAFPLYVVVVTSLSTTEAVTRAGGRGPAATAGRRFRAGVQAARVAVPDLDDRVRDRLARLAVLHLQGQPQLRALLVLADVAADLVGVEVVRTLGGGRGERAGPRAGEQRGEVRVGHRLQGDGLPGGRRDRALARARRDERAQADRAHPGEQPAPADALSFMVVVHACPFAVRFGSKGRLTVA